MSHGRFCSIFVVLAVVAGVFVSSNVLADEDEKRKMKIAVCRGFEPMVIQDSDSTLRGLDIDLWNAVANEMSVETEFVVGDFQETLDNVVNKKTDGAISGITINAAREEVMDFTHHYLDSGLMIMVNVNEGSGAFGFVTALYESGLGKWLLIFLAFLFIAANVAWFAERGSDAISDHYLKGLPQALWFVIVTAFTVGYGDFSPNRWFGRGVAVVVMFVGISMTCILTGMISSVMTVDKLEADVDGLGDLQGKVVATVEGSTSVGTLQKVGARVLPVKEIGDAFDLLERGQVKAVVYDAPALLYYANTEGFGKVIVAGEVFDPQYYGIALQEGSPYREEVNRALLKFKNNGVLDNIRRNWLGNSN